MRTVTLVLFLLGYLVLGVLGTRTQLVFQWPAYILLGIAGVLALLHFKRHHRVSPDPWCLGSTLLLTGYVVVRAGLSPVQYFGRMEIALVLAALVCYLLFALFFARSRYRLVFVSLLAVLSLGNILVGSYQLASDPSFMLIPGTERVHLDGVGGFFDNHNHLGGFLVISAGFLLSLLVFGRMGQMLRVLVLFLVPVCLVGIAITASRGSLLSLATVLLAAAGLGLFLAKSLFRYEFKKIAIVAVALMGITLIPAVVVGKKALAGRHGVGSGDAVANLTLGKSVRLTNWSLALDQFKDFPVFGQGARMYDIYSVKHWPGSMNWVRGDPEFAHNDYLQMLGEYGAVGIAIVLLFILAHVIAGMRYLIWYRLEGYEKSGRRTSNDLALCFGSLVILAGYAVHSILDFNLHLPTNLVPVAFAFSILACPSARPWRPTGCPAWLVISGRVLLPVCGAVLVAGGLLYGPAEYYTERARKVGFSDYPEMISQLDKALETDRGNFRTHQLRGTALMYFGFDFDIDVVRKGFMNRAGESFEHALESNPYDLFSIVGLARCLGEVGDYERAEELFLRAIEIGPWRREPHLRYGDYHLARGIEVVGRDLVQGMGRFEKAKAEYEASRMANDKILQQADRGYQALYSAKRYLAIVYEEHGHRLVEAAEGAAENGGREAELAYLRSGEDYFMRAQAEGARTSTLGPALARVRKRLERP